jgi:hypothetical protein
MAVFRRYIGIFLVSLWKKPWAGFAYPPVYKRKVALSVRADQRSLVRISNRTNDYHGTGNAEYF